MLSYKVSSAFKVQCDVFSFLFRLSASSLLAKYFPCFFTLNFIRDQALFNSMLTNSQTSNEFQSPASLTSSVKPLYKATSVEYYHLKDNFFFLRFTLPIYCLFSCTKELTTKSLDVWLFRIQGKNTTLHYFNSISCKISQSMIWEVEVKEF